MRKIRMGAIQPAVLPVAPLCDCLLETYCRDADFIMQQHVLPELDVNLALLEEAGNAGLDIVTSSEDMCALSHYLIDVRPGNLFSDLASRSARMCEERVSALAAKHHMYIVACYMKPACGQIYNMASIFDRNGRLCGEYRKTHLPPNELWHITPGDSIPVFSLDFGTVGIEICYDMMFPEVSSLLSLQGAEVVLHPTGGYGWYDAIGEATLRTRANDGSFYLVTAKNHIFSGAGKSSVIDYWGQVLADAGFYENALVWRDIDLDVPKAQPSWFYPTGMSGEARVRKRYEGERRPDLYGKLCADAGNRFQKPTPKEQERIRALVEKKECRW